MSSASPVAKNDGGSSPGAEHPALKLSFRVYKIFLSPLLHAFAPSRCLYLPTCSEYAYTAVDRFGVVRGSWLALRRFARCHPWGKGGLDPVPMNSSKIEQTTERLPSRLPGENTADRLP